MSHPLGVVPEGNLLFSADAKKSLRMRYDGLGSFFYRMTDEQIIELLSFLDAETLIRLSGASRVFHMFCTLDFLWRDIVLTICDDAHQSIKFDTTWRQTYYRMRQPQKESFSFPVVRVDGYPSGFLFKQWLCGNIRFERDVPHFYKHQDIPRIPLEEMTVERFVEEFERPNRPVIIRNAAAHWPAMQKWKDDAYLINECEKIQKTFRATSAAASRAATFSMKDYLHYATTVKEEAPLYLFERDFAQVPALKADFEVPQFFREQNLKTAVSTKANGETQCYTHQPDLFSLLGEGKRPDYRWMVIGPASSGSLFHIDPNMTNAWNVSVRGRKKWIFYPPTRVPPGVQRSEDGADVTVPISTSEWLLTFWSYHLEARHDPDVSQRPLEAIAEEGDLFFVPHGWWHMVVNLDFNLALTQNYVSTSNLSDVLRFVRDKRDQVSGVRDRSEAIQPDHLYEEFVATLQQESANGDSSAHKAIPAEQLAVHVAESRIEFDINRDEQAPTNVLKYPSEQSLEVLPSTRRENLPHKSNTAQHQRSQSALQAHRRRKLMKTRHHYSSATPNSNSHGAGGLLPPTTTTKKAKRVHDDTDEQDSSSCDNSDISGELAQGSQPSRRSKHKKARNELSAIFASSGIDSATAVTTSDTAADVAEVDNSGFSFSFF
eukprot:gene9125-6564_t